MKKDKILIKEVGLRKAKPCSTRKYRFVEVECPTCSARREITATNFKACKTTMCNACKASTHKDSTTPLYKVWTSMKQRCTNEKSQAYKYYGAKGITVDKEWKTSFTVFKEWAISQGYKNGLTIDRIDESANYTAENCRWVTQEEQVENRRLIQENNTSNYRCVNFEPKTKKWSSTLVVKKERHYLGTFPTKEEAAQAYNDFIIKNELNRKLNIITKE